MSQYVQYMTGSKNGPGPSRSEGECQRNIAKDDFFSVFYEIHNYVHLKTTYP